MKYNKIMEINMNNEIIIDNEFRIDTEINQNKIDAANINIFRYKFKEEFTNELYVFSKVHQYDERKQFKEAWIAWSEENNEIIQEEVERISKLGYNKDILDKMFKSARYYFRKKSTGKVEPAKRRVYVGVQKDLLKAMDQHINDNIINPDYKPSEGFNGFCKENIDLLKNEVNILCQCGIKDPNEIKNKIKKTYKNRYFSLTLKKA